MFKRRVFKHLVKICAYLLAVVMPLQSIAASNMLVCNSMMQASMQYAAATVDHSPPIQAEMLCHTHQKTVATDTSDSHTTMPLNCKIACGVLCVSLSTADLPQQKAAYIPLSRLNNLTNAVPNLYVSITLASLQRPPIHLS